MLAATHRDLETAVEDGSFREDFYYRLWGTVLEVPALRARREDIPLPVEHFRVQCNRLRSAASLEIPQRANRSPRRTSPPAPASWSAAASRHPASC